MRYLSLPSAFLFFCVLGCVSGLGARGAAEKVLYFYAYLTEAAMTPDNGKTTIAPDCAFAMKTGGKPCDLNQFLHYIWAPDPEKPNQKPPKDYVVTVYNAIVDTPFRDYADPVKVNGESDYYISLSKLGQPIAAVDQKLETYAVKPNRADYDTANNYNKAMMQWEKQKEVKADVEKLLALAKEAARDNLMLRYKDMEEYRIKNGNLASLKYLGVKPMTKTVVTKFSSPERFLALSAELTLEEYEKKQKIKGFRKTFLDACRKYRADDADHFRALAAAASAARGAKCEDVPQIDGLYISFHYARITVDLDVKDWEIARAVTNPDRVRELLSQGHKPDAFDLCEAALQGAEWAGAAETLEILLATGAVDANARPGYADLTNTAGVEEDWSSSDKSSLPPEIYGDPDEWYPLHLALTYTRVQMDPHEQKRNMTRMATALLQHGADPYALFRQTIRVYSYLSRYPGELHDDRAIDENFDLGITQRERREEREQYLLHKFISSDSNRPLFPRKYGVCSIIHFLLQEGEFVKPVLDFLGSNLNLEHRDPQGRTILLSACRSALGADAAIDGVHGDLFYEESDRGIQHNPFPQADNCWKTKQLPGVTTTTSPDTPTLLEYFVNRGANVVAVDNYGKNALHHLLKARHQLHSRSEPPVITASLRYVANNYGSLVNQPDKAGVYPFIAALSRIRAYWLKTEHLGRLESTIDDLLAAGADPLVRDPRGNTALHYLALSWLDDFGVRGDEQRRLCRLLLDRGVDPNARNVDGQSALELYFTAFDTSRYQNRQGYSRNVFHDMDEPYAKIDEEVLEIFERAWVNLTAQDPEGQTLLHIVAGKGAMREYERLMLLLAKGLDPMVRNAKGETAIDVAMSLEEPGEESFFATIMKDHIEGLNG